MDAAPTLVTELYQAQVSFYHLVHSLNYITHTEKKKFSIIIFILKVHTNHTLKLF